MNKPDPKSSPQAGLLLGVGAYFIWGLSPIYFKQLRHVLPIIILCHRVVWSVVFLAILLTIQRAWPQLRDAVRSRGTLLTLGASTLLIAFNWYTFIWTITT